MPDLEHVEGLNICVLWKYSVLFFQPLHYLWHSTKILLVSILAGCEISCSNEDIKRGWAVFRKHEVVSARASLDLLHALV